MPPAWLEDPQKKDANPAGGINSVKNPVFYIVVILLYL